MLRLISIIGLKLFGFKITGDHRPDLLKKIYAVVPHTSNWDFPIGLMVMYKMRFRVNYFGKASLFKGPFSWIFTKTGGIPINRSKSNNTVQDIVEIIKLRETFTLALAPEGTRAKVDKLKKGFYHISKLAEIPIVLVRFDYQNKIIDFGELFLPSDDIEMDFQYIRSYFNGVLGKNPENSLSV